jgi:hypothetical protein
MTTSSMALSLLFVAACTTDETPADSVAVPRTTEVPADTGTAQDVVETLTRDDGSTYRTVPFTQTVTASARIGEDGGLSGTLRYAERLDGDLRCGFDYALRGTPSATACEDCDFSFDVQSERTAEEGDPSLCYAQGAYTLEDIAGDGMRNAVLQHLPSFTTPSYTGSDGYGNEVTWGGYVYEDLLRSGFESYSPAYSGPYGEWPEYSWGTWFTPIAWVGSPSGTFARVGDDLSWSWTQSYDTYAVSEVYTSCADTNVTMVPTTRRIGLDAVTGTVPCDGSHHDGWTFEARAGDIVNISVDTVAEDTTFDPMFWVNGPDTCTLATLDDTFACTFPPPSFSCPSGKFEAPVDGTYEVFVAMMSGCVGETGAYTLDVQVM